MGLEDRTPPGPAEYAAYKERFSNWGRWGADDELGTLNHVTEEARRQAAALVREGRSISLSRPIDTHASARNPYPAQHLVPAGRSGGPADYLGLFIHGFANTHLDALSHVSTADGRRFFNGRARGEGFLPRGHTCGIDFWRDGIVTRGVLYDIPRLRGVDCVAPGQPVHGWDLQDAAQAQGVEPRRGDAVLVRSGAESCYAIHGDPEGWSSPAGVHVSALEFLWTHEAALLGWDLLEAPEADQGLPNPLPIESPVHIHCVAIPYMGLPLLDNLDLERLARECAAMGRWEFQLVVAPLVIENGTGSPVNPLALF